VISSCHSVQACFSSGCSTLAASTYIQQQQQCKPQQRHQEKAQATGLHSKACHPSPQPAQQHVCPAADHTQVRQCHQLLSDDGCNARARNQHRKPLLSATLQTHTSGKGVSCCHCCPNAEVIHAGTSPLLLPPSAAAAAATASSAGLLRLLMLPLPRLSGRGPGPPLLLLLLPFCCSLLILLWALAVGLAAAAAAGGAESALPTKLQSPASAHASHGNGTITI
jgi:hypothetical protein